MADFGDTMGTVTPRAPSQEPPPARQVRDVPTAGEENRSPKPLRAEDFESLGDADRAQGVPTPAENFSIVGGALLVAVGTRRQLNQYNTRYSPPAPASVSRLRSMASKSPSRCEREASGFPIAAVLCVQVRQHL